MNIKRAKPSKYIFNLFEFLNKFNLITTEYSIRGWDLTSLWSYWSNVDKDQHWEWQFGHISGPRTKVRKLKKLYFLEFIKVNKAKCLYFFNFAQGLQYGHFSNAIFHVPFHTKMTLKMGKKSQLTVGPPNAAMLVKVWGYFSWWMGAFRILRDFATPLKGWVGDNCPHLGPLGHWSSSEKLTFQFSHTVIIALFVMTIDCF